MDSDNLEVDSLRRATAADAAAIAHVAELAFATYLDRMDGQRPGPMDLDYRSLVTNREGWVVDQGDGEIAGFMILIDEGASMLVEAVAVHPDQQGSGHGRTLLALAEQRARDRGCDRVHLCTNEAMVENQALYERIGYVETHRAVEDGFARVFYELDLRRPHWM